MIKNLKINKTAHNVCFIGSISYKSDLKLFKQVVNSIKNQKNINYFIALCVDGKIKNEMYKFISSKSFPKNNRIYYSEKSKGLSYSLNKLINIFKKYNFEFFSRFDDDDIFNLDKTYLQIRYMTQNKIDICGTWSREFIDYRHFFWKNMSTSDNYLKKNIFKRSPFIHSSIIFKKTIFNKFNYDPNYKELEDLELWFRISSNDPHIKFGNMPIYAIKQYYKKNYFHRRSKNVFIKELFLKMKYLKFNTYFISNFSIILIVFLIRCLPEFILKIIYKNFR